MNEADPVQAERRRLLSALSDLTSTSKCLNDELAAFRAADPEKYERKTRAVEVGKEAAFRWTGQFFSPSDRIIGFLPRMERNEMRRIDNPQITR